MKKIYIPTIFILLFMIGCTSSKPLALPDQKVSGYMTEETIKNKRFTSDLHSKVYIALQDATIESTNAQELPRSFQVLINSILADFKNVEVLTRSDIVADYLNNSETKDKTFLLNGAITRFDKGIMSKSTSFDIDIDFGGGDAETNTNADFSSGESQSVLGTDFYLTKERGSILYKTSSKITVTEVRDGYSFGVRINNGGIGYRTYTDMRHGVDESIRKLLEASMRDLVSQVTYGQKVY